MGFASLVVEAFECALVVNVTLQPDASTTNVHVNTCCDMLF